MRQTGGNRHLLSDLSPDKDTSVPQYNDAQDAETCCLCRLDLFMQTLWWTDIVSVHSLHTEVLLVCGEVYTFPTLNAVILSILFS